MGNSYDRIYQELLDWILGERCLGYDPYDGCQTRFDILRSNRPTRLFLTYFNKFSPLNLRPIFGIPKTRNCYALSLISLSLMKAGVGKEELVSECIEYIRSQSLVDKYGYHCWNGNGLFIQSRHDYQTPDIPGIIGTEICGLAILDYYRRIRSSDELESLLKSIRDFYLKVLLTRFRGTLFFRYKPINPDWDLTFNASFKAALMITEINREFGWLEGDDVARECLGAVLSFQRPDGSWFMGVDLRTGREKKQIDFHQGFILDAILRYMELCGEEEDLLDAYLRGVHFYRTHQFMDNGQCYYRFPKKWPVNIHNQSQGIITFAKAARYNASYGEFARTVADWTIEHMRDPAGFFYYHKYPFLTIKIPYMRWSQANMLYALTYLISEPTAWPAHARSAAQPETEY